MKLELPPLAEGETYIGALGGQAGNLTHIILLPGDNDDNTWKKQLAWAKKQGGDLPARLEPGLRQRQPGRRPHRQRAPSPRRPQINCGRLR